MSDRIVPISDDLWSVRGSFKVAGLLDIGTQCTLVRRPSGSFVLLDGYTLEGEVRDEVMALTDDGRAVEAILHLHPFHTVHVRAAAAQFPGAQLFGTERHVAKAPELPWQPLRTDDPELHARFPELGFTVPRGVELIPADEKLHFSSVLAIHPASGSLIVDDTLTYTRLPLVGGVSFHPTLGKVLERRPGAAADFRAWAEALAVTSEPLTRLLPAHVHLPEPFAPGALADAIRKATAAVESTLRRHETRYGA